MCVFLQMYNIYNEGNLEFSGLSRQFLFRRLEPFSTYTLVLEACTGAGCTRTPPQPITTEEAPPSAPPPLVAERIRASSVQLNWVPPTHPNGRILQYRVMAVTLDKGRSRTEEGDLQRAKVVFTENNTQASSFSHNVTGLQPWSRYGFLVRVVNAAGHRDSPWLTVNTKQASPKGLAPPSVTHVEGNPYELEVSWTPPLESNGVLMTYRIQRDNASFHFSFDSGVLRYTDADLLPFTAYSYAITACTLEGCVTSDPTEIRTLEAPPATVEDPTATNITSHSATISWTVPSIQTGEITLYVLLLDGEEVYRGRRLSASASGLLPYTRYELVLEACTNGGCTASAPPTTLSTREAPPAGLRAPVLKVTGSESVEVSWREPERPNGVVTGYELRRNGQLVYVGTDTR